MHKIKYAIQACKRSMVQTSQKFAQDAICMGQFSCCVWFSADYCNIVYFTVIIVWLITAAVITKKITQMSLLSKIQFTAQFLER